ncbi:MAG: AlwI family type II restriction endonuclease, partial [Oscillospiraceae bacterium]|nr:AlwI family type II restriction endonuclease [Oscillospiraceae bacterium]
MNDNKQLQIEYYQFMHKEGFVKGNAPNPAKDARQKTSGLVDIGLIDSERNLTEVGRVLLSIAQNSDFKSDNPLQIPKDSFIYLKQLLKMSDNIDGNVVRPFVVAAYVVSKLDYLSNDEFTYLLPLCINKEKTNSIINDIFAVRNKSKSIDDVIIDTLMSMDNYKSALQFFQSSEVTEDVIGKIGINRKSGSGGVQNYDKPYFKFYTLLHDVVLNKNAESVLPLLEQSSKINGKAATLWRKALFQTTART